MKQYVIDIVIVLFILCIGQIYFGNHNVEQTFLNRNIDKFEEKVSQNTETVSYGSVIDREDNKISLFMKEVSQIIVKIIEGIVYVFSQIISMLFVIVVY